MARKPLSIEQQLAKLAESLGMDVPTGLNELEASRREADSVILYLESPDKFREVNCRECRLPFSTNYASVAMCSDTCRIFYLHRIGIEWSPAKSQEERWAGKIPLVCGPEALALAKLALKQSV